MRRLLLFLLVAAFALTAVAQAKHPFTFEDMMKLRRVGEPQPSPDGKWVLFSVVDVDLEANTKTPHIWIVPLTGGPADTSAAGVPHVSPNMRDAKERVLVPDQDGDRPRWSPDGKRFAFLSTKEGGSQVWTARFDSGTGRVTGVFQLTAISTEAGGELWSPDGKNILFTSDVYPECDGSSDALCNDGKRIAVDSSKVKALIFDRLLYRHWNAYKAGKRTHIFLTDAETEIPAGAKDFGTPVPRDLTPGDYDAPVFSLGGQDNYAFSPDGNEICYASNHENSEAASTNNDLWIVPASGGPAKNVTADNPASDSTPLYSPDGRYIAYRAQQRPGYESDRFRLMLYDRKTGEKKNLTDEFDRWVGTFTWAPDSKLIYFGSEDGGEAPLYALDPGHKTVLRLATGFNDDFVLSSSGRALFMTRMSLQSPIEIAGVDVSEFVGGVLIEKYRVECSGTILVTGNAKDRDCKLHVSERKATQITQVNAPVLSQVAMSPLESFWFTGADGDKVEGFLVKPPDFDAAKKYPVKFLIHGGPQGAWGDDWSYRWNPELFAANGYVVIMINFHGSTGYGQKFIDAINGDWGGAPYEDLMKGLDYAEQHYGFIDKTRECALGASYGGYAINWILGHSDRFKCLVSHDGMFNAESAWGTTEELWFNNWEFKGTPYDNRAAYQKWSPHQYAKNFRTPTLVIHGQRDYRLDVSEGLQLFTTLQVMGVPSKMLYFPDEGHWVLKPQNSKLWYETVNAWIDQWTKK